MSQSNLANLFFKSFFAIKEKSIQNLVDPKNILVVRQHNQFGDMLASVPLFRAIKETFPNSKLSLITSPDNYFAVEKNKFIDSQFCFDKSNLKSLKYILKLKSFLKREYDAVIIPSTVSLSFTSHFLGRLANAKTRICASSLNGEENKFSYLCDQRIEMDWRKVPSKNVSDFILDLVRPIGINTNNLQSEISFDQSDENIANLFFQNDLKINNKQIVIGLHTGAGKPPNRWNMKKFVQLSEKLINHFNCKLYFTGSGSDSEQLEFLNQNLSSEKIFALNKKIPELAAIISKSDLFITNDTGVMHVAGAVNVKQISLFGPTDPKNWAPVGNEKYYLRKSDSINDIEVDDVFNLAKDILEGNYDQQKFSRN